MYDNRDIESSILSITTSDIKRRVLVSLIMAERWRPQYQLFIEKFEINNCNKKYHKILDIVWNWLQMDSSLDINEDIEQIVPDLDDFIDFDLEERFLSEQAQCATIVLANCLRLAKTGDSVYLERSIRMSLDTIDSLVQLLIPDEISDEYEKKITMHPLMQSEILFIIELSSFIKLYDNTHNLIEYMAIKWKQNAFNMTRQYTDIIK